MQVAAIETSSSATISCEENYTLVGENCYFVSSDTHMGSSAEKYCIYYGGHAAIIESQEERDLLKGKGKHIGVCSDLRRKIGIAYLWSLSTKAQPLGLFVIHNKDVNYCVCKSLNKYLKTYGWYLKPCLMLKHV